MCVRYCFLNRHARERALARARTLVRAGGATTRASGFGRCCWPRASGPGLMRVRSWRCPWLRASAPGLMRVWLLRCSCSWLRALNAGLMRVWLLALLLLVAPGSELICSRESEWLKVLKVYFKYTYNHLMYTYNHLKPCKCFK